MRDNFLSSYAYIDSMKNNSDSIKGGEGAKSIGVCQHPISECDDCSIKEKLTCEFQTKDSIIFNLTALLYAVPSIIGMILAGFGLWIIAYIAYWFFFQAIWENRMFCSHCPHYAEEGKSIHCYGNYGIRKLFRYHPEPMSLSEKIQFLAGITILLLFPVPFLILGEQYVLLLITIIGIIIWVGFQIKRMCTRCINFSCPMNRVPKQLVDKFLKRNEAMRKAWEEKGYQID